MIIEIFAITIASLLIGYFLGRGFFEREKLQEIKKEIKNKLNASPVGIINRPTAKTLYEKQHPEITETKKTMKNLFDNIFRK